MILISVFHLFIAEIFLVFFSLSQILTIFPSNNPRLVINKQQLLLHGKPNTPKFTFIRIRECSNLKNKKF